MALATTTRSIDEALERLAPQDRALLELSLRRRVADGALAELLGVPADQVARRREAALERLVEKGAAASRAEADERLVAHWRGAAPPAAAPAPRRRRTGWLALAALIAAGGAALVAATAGGGSGGGSGPPGQPARAPRCAPSQVIAFRRLNSTHGRGTVQLVKGRPRLRLRASRFLVPRGGGYAVWLISSPSHARRLYSTAETSIRRDIRLPRAWGRYRYIEVARAIPELTSSYSRLPLLRARLADVSPC